MVVTASRNRKQRTSRPRGRPAAFQDVDTALFAVKIPIETADMVRELAAESGKTIAVIMVELIEGYLDDLQEDVMRPRQRSGTRGRQGRRRQESEE